jgi:hypothetical protein
MITDLGTASIGVAVPGAVASAAAAVTVSGIAAPNVSAQLTAMASFTPQAVLPFIDQIASLQATITALQAAIAAGLLPPSLSAQATLAAAAVATLTANLGIIEAQLNVALGIQGLLATGGLRALVYSGPQDDMGNELAAELGSDTTDCHALILTTTSGATWTAAEGIFNTAP